MNDPSRYRIVVGDHSRTATEETEQVLTILRMVIHEQYNGNTYLNDIALITVTKNDLSTYLYWIIIPLIYKQTGERIDLSVPEVGTIALPRAAAAPGTQVAVAGWGATAVNLINQLDWDL